MIQNKKYNVRFVEYPTTVLIYDTVTIDISNYPELHDKSEQEIIEYIKKNIWTMKSNNSETYDSLGEEISDQDLSKEITSQIEIDIDVEVFNSEYED